jgi:predicted outer membrane protein
MLTSLPRKALLAVAVLSAAAVATAQQPIRPVQPAQPQGSQSTDHILEQWLIIDNQGEVELAKFAENKAASEDVKKFATMMQQDHADFINSLKQFHERHAAAAPGALPAQGAAAAQPRQPGGFNVIAMKHELGKQCLTSLKEELGGLEGKQFDTCYMSHQVASHMQMLDTLKVFKRHASPELAELISLGIDTTQDHLMHAKKWMKDFHGATAETARRPAATEKK